MVKIVFSDIDGTFLTPDSKVSKRTGKAVRSLLERDIPFVLVSARMPEAIYPITDQLGIQIPIISYSGGLVLSKEGETLASTEMAAADTARLLTVIGTKFPQVTVNYYAGRHWYVRDRSDQRVQTEIDITTAQPIEGDFDERLQAGELPNKILIMADPADCEQAERELAADFPMFHVVRSAPFLLEIMDRSVSKATGIRVMLDHFGLTAAESLSFGDNYNDLEMLRYTGMSVAMGNAPEPVKAAATEVTASNVEDGIYQYLVRNGLIAG